MIAEWLPVSRSVPIIFSAYRAGEYGIPFLDFDPKGWPFRKLGSVDKPSLFDKLKAL